ncbi:AAA family ATPase [Cyanothece sp. BG0011]|uniref:nucleotide-binding protein n=1 Tax=Cyanothece sp. BG0011 TaxID=2082950 RepID=UPI000D1EB054|nr:AAA family ATPase [Cyanothece sp. BG0011]
MILVCGGIKGGVGKSTVATTLTVIRANLGYDVLLVDADDQQTATDFTLMRNETLSDSGGAGYTSVQLKGSAVRTDTLRLADKYEDVIIDVGGRDTAGQRAALSIASIYLVPFLPASFDVWTLEKVGELIEEAKAFNPELKAYCFLNRADPRGSDNDEAAAIASEITQLTYLDASWGNRKAFRNASAQGLAVTEVKYKDGKAIAEAMTLYQYLFGS